MQSPLSNSTIRRNLRYTDYKYLPSTKSIILHDYRKKIVRNYITERIDFHKVTFTYQYRLTLDGNDNVKSWSKKNLEIVNRRPYKEGSIMIWDAMTHTDALLIRKVEGSLNSEKYCDLLTKDINPSLKSEMESFILQQDNVPSIQSVP